MTSRAKKIPELTAKTTLANNDLIIVEAVANSTVSTTSKMTATNLRKAMVRGPYANDTAANSAGIAVGEMYYTAAGDVKVRLT